MAAYGGDIPERLARAEAEQANLLRSSNRHDEWITAHDKSTMEQRDLVYKAVYETEDRVVERLIKVEEKAQSVERNLLSRLSSIEIRVGIITALAAALGAIVPTVLARLIGN